MIALGFCIIIAVFLIQLREELANSAGSFVETGLTSERIVEFGANVHAFVHGLQEYQSFGITA